MNRSRKRGSRRHPRHAVSSLVILLSVRSGPPFRRPKRTETNRNDVIMRRWMPFTRFDTSLKSFVPVAKLNQQERLEGKDAERQRVTSTSSGSCVSGLDLGSEHQIKFRDLTPHLDSSYHRLNHAVPVCALALAASLQLFRHFLLVLCFQKIYHLVRPASESASKRALTQHLDARGSAAEAASPSTSHIHRRRPELDRVPEQPGHVSSHLGGDIAQSKTALACRRALAQRLQGLAS
jgi:hypothetical protein